MKDEKLFGSEMNFNEFIEEYNNLSEKDNTEVEIIDLETRKTKILSADEFKDFIKDNNVKGKELD